jgi:hypothetical protein
MAKISLTLYTLAFLGSVPKSPTQMGSLSVKHSAINISRHVFKFLTNPFSPITPRAPSLPSKGRWNLDPLTPLKDLC